MSVLQDRDNFHELLQKQYESLDPTPYQEMGWNRYLELGLPTKKTEVFRYIKLRSLFALKAQKTEPTSLTKEQIAPHVLPECQKSVLVFVNGHYFPSLSQMEAIPDKVSVVPLQDAAKTYGTFLTNHWTKSLGEEQDPFVALNSALQGCGAFLYVPPKTIIESPIQILNVITGSGTLAVPRIQSFLGAQCDVKIISSHVVLEGDSHGINHVNDFHCEEGSRVTLYQTALGDITRCWHLEATRATLKRDCYFETVKISQGSLTTRYDYKVHLLGENSEVSLNSLNLLHEKHETHDNVLIHHHVPNCRSNQLYKNVLFDKSHASFEGKIYVEREAQQTEAYQLNANLLLSENARAESKPNLEIFADDVRASHGATFGQLEEEEIFYLKTRGLSEEVAKNSLIRGFCQEVLDKMAIPSLVSCI
ncbi:MAG: FeS cluster assembly protein SufD [Chlamydiae bacterium]|nr:FeS cluster assembly protein SufD [Chlamydiota bacterium]